MIKPTRYPMSPDDLSDLFGEAVNQGRNGKVVSDTQLHVETDKGIILIDNTMPIYDALH
jgi:hypothetical protein